MAIYLLLFSRVYKIKKIFFHKTVRGWTGRQDKGQTVRVKKLGSFNEKVLSDFCVPKFAMCEVTVYIILTPRTK